eukprot:GHVU01008717.1.p1 GENE.GHVU01008717.1~~GHVU01008717.1.p1  ORF type:complete len:192 (-),score=15.81 GHVU01008717.1:223-798(-)
MLTHSYTHPCMRACMHPCIHLSMLSFSRPGGTGRRAGGARVAERPTKWASGWEKDGGSSAHPSRLLSAARSYLYTYSLTHSLTGCGGNGSRFTAQQLRKRVHAQGTREGSTDRGKVFTHIGVTRQTEHGGRWVPVSISRRWRRRGDESAADENEGEAYENAVEENEEEAYVYVVDKQNALRLTRVRKEASG